MGNLPYSFECDAISREDLAMQIAASTRPAAALLGESSSGKSDILRAINERLAPAVTFYVRCTKSANGLDPAPFDVLVQQMLEAKALSQEWADLTASSDRRSNLRDALANAAAQQPLTVQFDDVHFADKQTLAALEYCIDRLQDYPVRWFLAASAENADVNAAIERLGGNDLLVLYRLKRSDEQAAVSAPSLEALSADERTVAVALAAADTVMDGESLGRVARFSRERVLRAIAGAERAGIVRSKPPAYAIAGRQVRDTIVSTAEASELRRLHLALARVESEPLRRAAHLEDAGAGTKAAACFLDVALDALASGRYASAAVACDGVMRTAGNRSPTQRAAHAISQLAHRARGTDSEGIVHVGRACIEEQLAPLSLDERVRCESAYYAAAVPFVSDRAGEAEAIANLLKRCSKNAVAGTAPLYWILAKLYYGSNQLERARTACERGLEASRQAYDPRSEVRLRIHLGFICAAQGDSAAAVELIESQIARAAALGFTEEFFSACCAAMYVFASLDRFDDAAKWGDYALDRPGPTSTEWTSFLSYNMASIDLMLGHPERALGRLALLRANPEPLRSPAAPMVMLLESTALLQMNRFEAASEMLNEALHLDSPDWVRLEVRNTQAILDELHGHREEALASATFVMRCKGEDSNTIRSRLAAATVVARLRYRLGWLDFAEPAGICEEACERFTVARVALGEVGAYAALAQRASVENARGLVTATAANPDRFVRALNVFEAGRAAAQSDLLAAAVAEFEAIGSPVLAGRARREATAQGLTLAARVRHRRHLTSREAELARHVASGKTNVEIGRVLGLSPKTVGHHLSSILGKCGVRSRVDIAALVIRGALPIHEAV